MALDTGFTLLWGPWNASTSEDGANFPRRGIKIGPPVSGVLTPCQSFFALSNIPSAHRTAHRQVNERLKEGMGRLLQSESRLTVASSLRHTCTARQTHTRPGRLEFQFDRTKLSATTKGRQNHAVILLPQRRHIPGTQHCRIPRRGSSPSPSTRKNRGRSTGKGDHLFWPSTPAGTVPWFATDG